MSESESCRPVFSVSVARLNCRAEKKLKLIHYIEPYVSFQYIYIYYTYGTNTTCGYALLSIRITCLCMYYELYVLCVCTTNCVCYVDKSKEDNIHVENYLIYSLEYDCKYISGLINGIILRKTRVRILTIVESKSCVR